MKKSGMTFYEALKVSWKRELEIRDPKRILSLSFWTVWLTIYRVPAVLMPRAFWWVMIALGLATPKK